MRSRVHVDAGICGLGSTISAASDDGQMCTVKVKSECEAIRALGREIGEVDGYEVAFKTFSENPIYQAADRHYRHAACPVPAGIIKAVEVACGLALPKDVAIVVNRVDDDAADAVDDEPAAVDAGADAP